MPKDLSVGQSIAIYAPILIAALALLVSGLSMWLGVLNYRRAVMTERPVATASIRTTAQADWYLVTVKVDNRKSCGVRWDATTFRKPRGALAMHEREGRVVKSDVNAPNVLQNPLPISKGRKSVASNASLAQVGKDAVRNFGIVFAIGSTHELPFLAFVPASRSSRKLSIRVTLFSIDAVERKIEIDIIRTLPQASKTAAA
jgi:hypothetical protein